MKYFTRELWIGFNSPRRDRAFRKWDSRLQAYRANLKQILPGLDPRARRFFQDPLILHDGTLTRMEVGDRINDVLGSATRGFVNRRAAVIRLFVLSDTVDQHCYILEYKDLNAIELDLSGKVALFPVGMYLNFGDWGYDELTSPKLGLFRHEILFSSGATISIEFRKVSVRRRRSR